MTSSKTKQDLWVNPANPLYFGKPVTARVFLSTYTRGNRFSMNGRDSGFKVEGASLGRNFFSTRADAHAALAAAGWVKVAE